MNWQSDLQNIKVSKEWSAFNNSEHFLLVKMKESQCEIDKGLISSKETVVF